MFALASLALVSRRVKKTRRFALSAAGPFVIFGALVWGIFYAQLRGASILCRARRRRPSRAQIAPAGRRVSSARAPCRRPERPRGRRPAAASCAATEASGGAAFVATLPPSESINHWPRDRPTRPLQSQRRRESAGRRSGKKSSGCGGGDAMEGARKVSRQSVEWIGSLLQLLFFLAAAAATARRVNTARRIKVACLPQQRRVAPPIELNRFGRARDKTGPKAARLIGRCSRRRQAWRR